MKIRLLIALLPITLVLVTGLLALAYFSENRNGKQMWQDTKEALEASEVSLELSDVLPPDDTPNNFANHPIIAALTSYDPGEGNEVIYHSPEIRDQFVKMRIPNSFGSRNYWAHGEKIEMLDCYRLFNPDQGKKMHPKHREIRKRKNPNIDEIWTSERILQHCKQLEGDLTDSLYKAHKKLPNSQLPFELDELVTKRYSEPTPFLLDLVKFLKFLEVKAQVQIDLDDYDGASQSLELIFRTRQLLSSHPTAISCLLSYAATRASLRVLWFGMDRGGWHKEHLLMLNENLQAIDLIKEFQQIIHSEGIIYQVDFTKFIIGSNSREQMLEEFTSTYHSFYKYTDYMPEGWFLSNLSYYTRATHKHLLEPLKNRDFATLASGNYDSFLKTIPKRYTFYSDECEVSGNQVLNSFTTSTLALQTYLSLATSACRIETFLIDKKRQPEDDELSSLISVDPFRPENQLVYKIDDSNERYILYSVSGNGTDDSGVPTPPRTSFASLDISKNDLCWRYSKPE